MKKYRPVITLFIVLILPLLVYGFLKLVAVQNYKPIETISEKIPNPDGSLDSVFKSIGEFSFQTQTGKPLTRDSIDGKIWVVNLFYGDCGEDCDKIHSQISKLQSDYQDDANVRFLSISVDPKRDSLPALQGYAKRVEAVPYRWYFATGDPTLVQQFLTNELHYKPTAPEDLAKFTLRETSLRLIDWNGLLRGEYYDGLRETEVVRMSQHMVLLEKEMLDPKSAAPTHP
jgi:protein SCO1